MDDLWFTMLLPCVAMSAFGLGVDDSLDPKRTRIAVSRMSQGWISFSLR